VKFFALGIGILAIGLLIMAVRYVVKGRIGAAIGIFVVAVLMSGIAGAIAASA
jgi:hypothetical protein